MLRHDVNMIKDITKVYKVIKVIKYIKEQFLVNRKQSKHQISHGAIEAAEWWGHRTMAISPRYGNYEDCQCVGSTKVQRGCGQSSHWEPVDACCPSDLNWLSVMKCYEDMKCIEVHVIWVQSQFSCVITDFLHLRVVDSFSEACACQTSAQDFFLRKNFGKDEPSREERIRTEPNGPRNSTWHRWIQMVFHWKFEASSPGLARWPRTRSAVLPPAPGQHPGMVAPQECLCIYEVSYATYYIYIYIYNMIKYANQIWL